VLAEEDSVARLHVERDLLAVVGHLPGADGDDLALLGLLLRGVRDDDAASADFLLLDPLHENAIMQRTKLRLGRGRSRHTRNASVVVAWDGWAGELSKRGPTLPTFSTRSRRVLM